MPSTLHLTNHMPDDQPDQNRQLIGVQYLRGIAALMVAYYHAIEQVPDLADPLRSYCLGNLHLANGVDLFFVISGFIMVLTSSRATPGDFIVRRCIRIVPLYWLLTTFLMILVTIKGDLFRSTVASTDYFLKSLLFIPYANAGQQGQMFPMLVPGWSLNMEMYFYLVFALALFLPRKTRLFTTGVFFLLTLLLAPRLGDTRFGREIVFYGDFKLLEFWFGMLIAEWYVRRGTAGKPLLGAMLMPVGMLLLMLGSPIATGAYRSWPQVFFDDALPAVLVMIGTLMLETTVRRRPLRWLQRLGDASYSMYLSHIFLLGVLRVVWTWAGLAVPSIGHAISFAIVSLAISAVGAWYIYRLLELPLTRTLQSAYRRVRRTAVSVRTG